MTQTVPDISPLMPMHQDPLLVSPCIFRPQRQKGTEDNLQGRFRLCDGSSLWCLVSWFNPLLLIWWPILENRVLAPLGYCSGSLEPESSCHDRDWIMELPMEADILIFTGILTPEDAGVASCWPAHRAGLLWLNFFGQSGSVSKFPQFLCVKLWVGWVGRGYIEISRYFPALWINRVTLVTKIKLWYSLGY